VLAGADAQRALEAAFAVARALDGRPARAAAHQPLAEALAERALLHGYLDAIRPGEGHRDAALEMLDEAFEATASAVLSPALFGGFLGVAFIAQHLRRLWGEAAHLDAIDDALLAHLDAPGLAPLHDVTSGLSGVAAYALERLPARSASKCFERIVSSLSGAACEERAGLAWFTDGPLLDDEMRARHPRGHFDAGFAHGTPGVVGALAAMQLAGVGGERVAWLLRGAVRWVLTQRLGMEMPWFVGAGIVAEPARSAWCYGSPAAAWAILRAARAARDASWEREARTMALGAAARPADRCGVRDACLCHGAAGLGHLYARLFQATGEPALREAARDWVLRALGSRHPTRGLAGFQFCEAGDGALVTREDPSFLSGAIGVALAFVAAATDLEPAWDGRLLLSRPW